MKTLIAGAAIVLAVAFSNDAFAARERWYTDAQVSRGEAVYRDNCLECHQRAGAGNENWQQRDAEGKYPAPPLNGTAHAWHHDLEVLARTVREGGAKLGGSMPAFADKLDPEDVAAVIAYVQSLWPDEVFGRWAAAYPDDAAAGIGTPGAAAVATPAMNEDAPADEGGDGAITARLAALLGNGDALEPPEDTPVNGIFGVLTGSNYVYLDASGRYAFVGKLLDLETGEDLTNKRLGVMRREKLAGFAEADMAVFRANGEEKARLDVFTDTTCPYCRRLHSEVPALQRAGITVRYLPFPRGGTRGQGYREMRSVWCAADREAALTEAKSGKGYEVGDTDCAAAAAVDAGYRLGLQVGVTGTPAIILPDGRMIPGYRPWHDLATALGVTPQ